MPERLPHQRWGGILYHRPKQKPRRARVGHPEEMTVTSLHDAFVEMANEGSGVHRFAEEAIEKTKRLHDLYEMETGQRPSGYASQQPGVTDSFEAFVRRQEALERDADD